MCMYIYIKSIGKIVKVAGLKKKSRSDHFCLENEHPEMEIQVFLFSIVADDLGKH